MDDDRTLADLLAFTLRRAGFEPLLAFNTTDAMSVLQQEDVDVILLDVNLPGAPGLKDGFEVCRAIRRTSDVPIILLTVRDDEEDILLGLDGGADDYVVKPFSPRQLVARIQTVLRRAAPGRVPTAAPFIFDDCRFEPSTRSFFYQNRDPVRLTQLEARLLEYLMLNSGQIIPTEMIIDHVWGVEGGNTEMLRQLVRRVRTKIESNPEEPHLITNQPGLGYGFSKKR